MRLYRVTATGLSGEEVQPPSVFVGTQADASAARRAMAEAYNLRPIAQTKFEEVDVPTDKAGLIAFLNAELRG